MYTYREKNLLPSTYKTYNMICTYRKKNLLNKCNTYQFINNACKKDFHQTFIRKKIYMI